MNHDPSLASDSQSKQNVTIFDPEKKLTHQLNTSREIG
jgi:hypothetical protein